MEVFRIAMARRASELIASGAANRWNRDGQYVIYTASSGSLATLELVVHSSAIRPKTTYRLMIIRLDDDERLYREIKTASLPGDWRLRIAYPALQAIGSEWYTARDSLVLKVPSAVIPREYNYIINTQHPDFDEHVELVDTEEYFWDTRLLNR